MHNIFDLFFFFFCDIQKEEFFLNDTALLYADLNEENEVVIKSGRIGRVGSA